MAIAPEGQIRLHFLSYLDGGSPLRLWIAKHLTGLTLLLYATSGLGATVIGNWCLPTAAEAGEHAAHGTHRAAPLPCPPLKDGSENCRGQCLDVQPRLLSHTAPHRAARTELNPVASADPPGATSVRPPHSLESRRHCHEIRALGPLLAQRHLGTVVLIV